MEAPDPISEEVDWDWDSGFHKAVWTKLAYCTRVHTQPSVSQQQYL